MAAWLLVKMIDVGWSEKFSSVYRDLCHSTCLVMCVAAMYSASAVDSVTVACFLELHAMAPPAMIVT